MLVRTAAPTQQPSFRRRRGELFVVRNVAALVPPFEEGGGYHGTSAAIEFAVSELAVPEIVVMGHGLCGGIAAALSDRSTGRFIGPWVELLAGIRAQLCGPTQTLMLRLNRRYSSSWPYVLFAKLDALSFCRAAVAAGRLHLYGAWFAIAEGELEWLDGASGRVRTRSVRSLPALTCCAAAALAPHAPLTVPRADDRGLLRRAFCL